MYCTSSLYLGFNVSLRFRSQSSSIQITCLLNFIQRISPWLCHFQPKLLSKSISSIKRHIWFYNFLKEFFILIPCVTLDLGSFGLTFGYRINSDVSRDSLIMILNSFVLFSYQVKYNICCYAKLQTR